MVLAQQDTQTRLLLLQRNALQRAYRDEQGHLGSPHAVGLALYGDLLTAAYLSALCLLPDTGGPVAACVGSPARLALMLSRGNESVVGDLPAPVHRVEARAQRERCVGFYAHDDQLGGFGRMKELQILSDEKLAKRLQAAKSFHGLAVAFSEGAE